MKSILTGVLVSVLLAGCSRHEHVSPNTLPQVPVTVAAVEAASLPQFREISGTVRPVRRAVLASKLSGSITDLPIALGQRVQAGDVLARLFSADVAARVTQAHAQLSKARRDLEREKTLQAKGVSTAEAVRDLQDHLTEAEATAHDAEVQLGYADIRAPFDGVIARRLVNAGDFAALGQPLLELEGTSEFEIEAAIPESLAAALASGSALDCVSAGVSFSALLKEISSTSNPETRSVGVKLSVPASAPVRSGAFTLVRVPSGTAKTLHVPASAVWLNGQMECLFVVTEGNLASLRLIKSGARQGETVEILAGLNGNERVILAPPASLRDGQPVEVRP